MPPEFPTGNDSLGEVLHLLRLTGTLYCRGEFTQPWAIDIPALPGMMSFIVITSGKAWLELESGESRLLEPGTLTLIPHGRPHRFKSDPSARAQPLFDIPVEKVSEHYQIMRHGGGGELTHSTYGAMSLDHVSAERLIVAIPPVLQLDSWEEDSSWLQSTLRLIASEARSLRPGGETVITRLADILVIQTIRAWLETAPEAHQGWFKALRDPQLGRALAVIHRNPEMEHTLVSLAACAGMSRSLFAARFTQMLGEPAMRYLTQWRMKLAHRRLQETSEPLSVLAAEVGYQSEAAFCRAFKREFGMPPGAVRQGKEKSA